MILSIYQMKGILLYQDRVKFINQSKIFLYFFGIDCIQIETPSGRFIYWFVLLIELLLCSKSRGIKFLVTKHLEISFSSTPITTTALDTVHVPAILKLLTEQLLHVIEVISRICVAIASEAHWLNPVYKSGKCGPHRGLQYPSFQNSKESIPCVMVCSVTWVSCLFQKQALPTPPHFHWGKYSSSL